VTTATGIQSAPQLVVADFKALGQQRSQFPVLGLTLPTAVTADGLLGLDFFRGTVLNIDFQQGLLTLQ
jgi:hypothetical protein